LVPAYLAFLGLLGWSGCLLFTDPINEAPQVSILPPAGQILVGRVAEFKVDNGTLHDDRNSPAELVIEWAVFESQLEGCSWITKSEWTLPPNARRLEDPMRLDRYAPYPFEPKSRAVACVCVRAEDLDGAWTFACERAVPAPAAAPEAVITDDLGIISGESRPLCSDVRLSAEHSRFVAGDTVTYAWSMSYEGSDPAGKNLQLGKCSDLVTSLPDAHKCFYAAVPGVYTVRLTITDTPPSGSTGDTLTSLEAVFIVNVATDTPPSLQQTDPDVHAQRILLARSSDLGSTYQSRTFKVLSVKDDCEPYPVPAGSPKRPAQFVWSIKDETKTTSDWVYQTNTTDSFTVSQAMFSKALPGDTIKVRVEARDAVVQDLYLRGISPCDLKTDICCGPNGCTGSDAIRWTTWTVQFQP
jgi:hypothetical protein